MENFSRDDKKKVGSKNHHYHHHSRTFTSSSHSSDSKKSLPSSDAKSKSKLSKVSLPNGKSSYKIPKHSSKQAESKPARAVEDDLQASAPKEKVDAKTPVISEQTGEEGKKPKNVISKSDDTDLYAKIKSLQVNPEMSISSIVRDLVFHDKVSYHCVIYCMHG